MKREFIVISAIFLLLTACSRRQPGVYLGEKEKSYNELSDRDVVIEVDGSKFFKADAEACVSLRKKIFSLMSPRLDAKNLEQYGNRVRRRIAREWMYNTLFLKKVEKEGIIPMPEDANRHQDFMAAAIKKKIKNSAESAKNVLGEDYAQFSKEMEGEVKLWALYRVKGLTDVKPNLVSNYLAKISKINESVAQSNKLVVAEGARIFKKLKAGLDFVKAVKMYSQETNPLDNGDMGWCTAEEIDEEEINSVVFTAAVNSVVGPFDTDDGLQILRVEGHDTMDPVEKCRSKIPTVKLRRIRLRMLLPVKTMTEKEAYREIVKSRIESFKRTESLKLKNDAVIYYPYGTNLFPKIHRKKSINQMKGAVK
jgi:hypothetical protein